MKKTTWFILFFMLISRSAAFAQGNDLSVTIQESVLNKMFLAIGEIKGTSAYSFMFIEGTYDWSLINPQIRLHPGHADFVSDVKISIGKYTYSVKMTGNTEVCYEPSTNLIYVEITDAKFPLNILFMGKVRNLWDVDLAPYFETPFTFDGPLTMGTEMVFEMPDQTTRRIYAHPVNCGVKIAEKQILVSAEMEFVNRDAVAPKPLLNSVNSTK